ncbi:MAG: hypothetical protein ACI39H_04020 [Lachnospiraceae bacterium]
MDVNSVKALSAYQNSSRKSMKTEEVVQTKQEKAANELLETPAGVLVKGSPSAVYEKSDLVQMMQNDAKARAQQLQNMVSEALYKQAGLSVGGDDVWKFLAKGEFNVTEEAKKQAQELISENGYYGVEQTSDRILQFAKALSGGDSSKASGLLDAFKKGFEQATKAWGKELPEISQKTYEAVEKKFQDWMNEDSKQETTAEE